jgi:hypothetical protein
MSNNFQTMYHLTKQAQQKEPFESVKRPSISYKFRFVSLISPYLLRDLRVFNITSSPSTPKKSTLLMKQSYLLMTWFYYLKESQFKIRGKSENRLKFSFLPTKRSMYTLTKAPMAHKTNSKEQFVFRTFRFKVSVKTFFSAASAPASVDAALAALYMTKSIFPIFETNLLLLKGYYVFIKMHDSNYFNYSRRL